MACKTTKLMKAAIRRHSEAIHHFNKVLEAKIRGDENPFYKEHSAEYYKAMAIGQSTMLESMLFEANCYHGFEYVDSLGRGPIRTDHPEFADWRRNYLIKE